MSNYIIIDTETTRQGTVLNLGYIVVVDDFIIKHYNVIIEETLQYDRTAQAKFNEKFDTYNLLPHKSIIEVLYTLRLDIKDNDATVYSYSNAHFDAIHINKTLALTDLSYRLPKDMFKDIHGMAAATICQEADYIEQCNYNDLRTKKGYISRTAQSVYRYISQDYEFQQSHTALDDCIMEHAIIQNILNQWGDVEGKVTYYKHYEAYCNTIIDL